MSKSFCLQKTELSGLITVTGCQRHNKKWSPLKTNCKHHKIVLFSTSLCGGFVRRVHASGRPTEDRNLLSSSRVYTWLPELRLHTWLFYSPSKTEQVTLGDDKVEGSKACFILVVFLHLKIAAFSEKQVYAFHLVCRIFLWLFFKLLTHYFAFFVLLFFTRDTWQDSALSENSICFLLDKGFMYGNAKT